MCGYMCTRMHMGVGPRSQYRAFPSTVFYFCIETGSLAEPGAYQLPLVSLAGQLALEISCFCHPEVPRRALHMPSI